MELQQRRVLVVRPRSLPDSGADRFVEQLAGAGAEPLHYPVMAIAPVAAPRGKASPCDALERIKQRVSALADYRAVIFVSRPAACLGGDWIGHYWPQLPVGVRFYAVGGGTAQVLAERGIDAVVPAEEMTSEGLLALPDLQQLSGEKVLICRGCGGRELLAEELRQRGAEVHYAELYRRQLCSDYRQPIYTALESGVDALAVHSGELLQALLALLPEPLRARLKTVPLLVPGQRLAALAGDAGFQQLVVAANALPECMVSALGRWYIKH